jgi:pyruvate/2-oxoglutarate dehydrogenase complex dihydrolipoamide acyltransferase (E2) component
MEAASWWGVHPLDPDRHADIHPGGAVATPEGPIVPVIRRADQRLPYGVTRQGTHLAEKAHARKLTLGDLSGGMFTITPLGAYGIETFTPIVNYPQCAIPGAGFDAARGHARPHRSLPQNVLERFLQPSYH